MPPTRARTAPSPFSTSTFSKIRQALLLGVALAGVAVGSSHAQNGSFGDWNTNGNGNWGDPARWSGATPANTYPSGIGATGVVVQDVSSATRIISLLDAAGTSALDITLGTLVLGDTNNSNAFQIGVVGAGGTLTFDNAGALNHFGTAGALLDHNYHSSASGAATAGNPFKQPNSGDRIDAQVILNDDLTILANRAITFYNAWTGNGNDITLDGLNTNRAYWVNNTTTQLGSISGVNSLNIYNGEARFDGFAGTADSQLIGATTINLGDGLTTTAGNVAFDSFLRVFPRLYLVNTETTQTAALNMNGGWLISDLGNLATLNGDGIDIWSGAITLTGAATTNIIDVNDAGAPEVHYISGALGGSGGFSKVNTGSLNLLADNTLTGDVYVQRAGPGGSALTAKGGLTLSGANGAFSGAGNIVVSRDGSFYLDNSAATNLDRVNDNADILLRGQGRMRVTQQAGIAVSETMGDLRIDTGSGRVNFDLNDTTPATMSLTFASLTRDKGTIAQFQVLDNSSGAFGPAGNAHLYFSNGGANLLKKGGDGANGSTSQTLVVGVFGGVNNLADHFMTFDKVNTTELRPLAITEYLSSRSLGHTLSVATLSANDAANPYNKNLDIDYNPGDGLDPDDNWYGDRPIRLTESVGVNSLRFGTNTPNATGNANNNNELGSSLVLNPGAVLYLGDSLAASTGLAANTDGSGMVLFGRDINGTAPDSNQFIIGGALDFGSREAVFVNESGNSALIRSEIRGTGGLTKAGANTIYLDNANRYTGVTNVAEAALILRHESALGGSHRVNIEGNGQLYLESGINILSSTISATPPDLFVGAIDGSRQILYSNAANNTWGGDVIIDTVDALGNWVFTPYIGTNALATLNIDGDIYSNELANPINRDTSLNDARNLQIVFNSAGGVVNLNGQVSDNALGVGGGGTGITSDTENQLLRVTISSSNEGVVNVRQPWNAAGRTNLQQGILRYEGDGNFYTGAAAAAQLLNAAGQSTGNGQSGMRIGSGNNSTANTLIVLTKDGQTLNIPRIDAGGDGTSNYNGLGNNTLAGTNTSGAVSFGLGTDRYLFGSTSAANGHVRDLSVYAAGGGTVNLNFVLEDQDADVHTSLTKIGRGTVNFNGGNYGAAARDGTVEQVTLSGGLLRLTNYGVNTGRRLDSGAMVVFAGGGIEMDGVGSIANETENLTGIAVTGSTVVPVGQTVVNPGATDVIVTSTTSRTTTLNIGSSGIALVRNAGGSLNFVQNNNGGSAVISFNGAGVGAGSGAAAFDAFVGGYATFTDTPGSVTNWAGLNNAFRVGAFTALSADAYGAGVHADVVTGAGVGSQAQTLRFNSAGAGLNLGGGTFSVNSGGILATSNLTSTTAITNGTLTRTGGGDLVIHNYGAGEFELGAAIANDGAAVVSLTLAGTGTTLLSGTNTYTGSTYFNGGTAIVASETNLGAVPDAVAANNLYFNGGILHVTADMSLSANRGITLGGNGGEVRVAADKVLTMGGVLASEGNLSAGYASNPAVGRFDKSGQGTLVLTALTHAHNGLTEVKEGTLKWQPAATTGSATLNVFGSTNAFLDSTVVRSGAVLDLSPRTAANNSSVTLTLNEWFTFEGGSRVDFSPLNDATNGFSDVRYNLRGVIQLDALGAAGTPAGNTTFNIVRREVGLGDAGGYLTGDGGLTKTGAGTLYFRENNPEWSGQLVHNEGTLEVYGGGNVLGKGTLPILLGHNLAAELSGEPDSGNTTAQLFIRDENGFRDAVTVTQDIIVRADGGAGTQGKRIGARYLAHEDVANWNGTLTLNDNVEFFYQDDTRNINDQFNASSSTAAANTRNDIRSYGAPTNAEVTFINFNGSIIGSKNITTNVSQGGNGNVANGSIVDPFDDMILLPVFGLNGDNSAWTGNLVMGNTSSDVDRIHTVSVGHGNGISAANGVTMHHNSILQLSGNDVTIGSLSNPAGAASIGTFIENAATGSGSITIVQNSDATVGLVFRDGLNYEELKPGEVDASLSLIKAGGGRLELTKPNSYTGFTALNNGTLKLSYGTDGSMLADSAVLRLNDGTLELAGTVAHEEIVGSTIVNGTVAITRSSGAATIRLNALSRLSGTLWISEDNLATTDTVNDPATGIIGGWATVGGSWAVNSTNAADGALVGLNAFSDVDRLGGIIADAPNANIRIIEAGTGSNVSLAGSGVITINTLLQGANGGPAVIEIGADSTLRVASGGVLLPAGSSPLVFAPGGSLTAGGSDDEPARLLLQNQNAAAVLTVGAAIINNGTGVVGLTTSGPGTTILTGGNTYTGTTLVTSGTLQLGDGGTTGNPGSGAVAVNASGTLAFNRSDNALVIAAPITGEGKVLQAASGRTTLGAATAANELTFIMGGGILATGTDQAINTTSALLFGASEGATAVGTLDLTAGSATAGGLRVQTNTTAVNNLIIGAGKTLTLNGDVLIGISTAPATDTRLTMSGGGNLVVSKPSGTFQVGGATGPENGNRAVLNMSDLASFTADLGSGGTLRVGDSNTNSSGSGSAASTLTLAADSTITAGTIGVGDRQGMGSSLATLNLGSGTTILNVDELNVGDRNQRGMGLLQFGGAAGTVRVRATDGVSRSNVNVLSSTAGTGYALSGNVDFTGHNADLYLGVLDIARRANGSGAGTGAFSFDQGTLDVTSVLLGRKLGGTGTATIKGTLNIGGGTVLIGSGGIIMAENTTATASRAEAVLNFTGGSITSSGDILKVGATGPAIAVATLNLTGTAILDMQGHDIGSAVQPIDVLTLASGTLKNIGQINGSSGLITAGTGGLLVLDGNNAYTGGTTVNNGTLRVTGNTGFGALLVNSGGTLTGAGLIRGTTTIANGGTVSPGAAAGEIATLHFDAGMDATFAAGSAAEFLLSATPGTNDQLQGTGTLTLDAGAMFTVAGWDGTYVPQDGDSWKLLDWTTIAGGFDAGTNIRSSGNGGGDLYLPELGTGFFWDVSAFTSAGIITVVVPEPGRAALLMVGALVLLVRRRRP